jgi:ABC-type transport system substrate-binding protein
LIRLLLLALLLVGCGALAPIGDALPRPGGPTPPPGRETAPPGRETAPPGRETAPARVRRNGPDVAVVALPAAPGRLDAPPAVRAPLTDQEVAEQMVAYLLRAGLVGIDDRGDPYPDLAERVPTLENGGARWVGEGDARQLEVTFRLRANAGLGAAEAVAAWRRTLDTGPPEIATERLYERVEARDPTGLVLTFFSERSARAAASREPNRYGFLRGQSGPVVDRLYYLGLPNTWVGAGPYRPRDPAAAPSARLVLEARPDYHRGAPKIRTLILRVAGPEALGQLAVGELDLLALERPEGATVDALQRLTGVRTAEVLGPAEERIEVNLARPGLGDRAAREALLRALDRPALAESALGSRLADEQLAADEAARRYPYDLAVARQRLHSAGWAPGDENVPARSVERPTLRLVTTDDRRRGELARLIKEQLARVDLEVVVETLPPGQLFDRQRGPLARGDFDLALIGAAVGLDPLADQDDWYGAASTSLGQLFRRAGGALARDEREAVEREVQERLLDELPSLPLFGYYRVAAASEGLGNVRLPRVAVPVTWNAHEWTLD